MIYHILNGDALKEQFPREIEGELIVARECMIEGPVGSKDLDTLVQERSDFMKRTYGVHDYAEKSQSEISKIREITSGEVNLWFEEDLFCQTNLWFVSSMLYQKDIKVNLVLPIGSTLAYGFGGLDSKDLIHAYKNKNSLTKINVNQLALLWFAYRNDDIERLLKLGVQVHSDFPFVMRAIEAHFDRLPKDGNPGEPERIIKEIMREKSTNDFKIIFQEFHKRAPIYGFGDLQVKRIFDSINI